MSDSDDAELAPALGNGKIYITADQLLRDAFELAQQVIESGFEPDFVVGVWRGGTPVAVAVHELMKYVGLDPDHLAIRTSYYDGIDQPRSAVQVHNLGYLVENVGCDDSVLIVDDVFDRGQSIAAILAELKTLMQRNLPHDIRTATVWFKPTRNLTDLVPNYYVHETDQWLIFPHELEGLTLADIAENKSDIASIVDRAVRWRAD